MTDTDRERGETHGPTLDVAQGLANLKTAELIQQIEQQTAAEAAAEAMEVLDDAGELADDASELEAQLEAALGDAHVNATDNDRVALTADWQTSIIGIVEGSYKYSVEGRFFARIANQLVDIRHATRIGQGINQFYPTFLGDQRTKGTPQLEIEALFDRARAGANAVFSLLAATIRTLDHCDPPGLRGLTPHQAPSSSTPMPVAARRGPLPPANGPAVLVQTPPLRGVPPHLEGNLFQSELPPSRPDPVRERVVRVQQRLEDKRKQGSIGVAPHVGRVAPRAEVRRRKLSGPIADRQINVERDPATALILASRSLLEDLRRRGRSVERERITRYCQSVVSLADAGRVSEQLGKFAQEVATHQNSKNVAKLATFFLADIKGTLAK